MFDKGINGEFVEALRTWTHWDEIINDRDLFVGIRREYINIYYQGCSLLKISFKEGRLKPETHYKYLVSPNVKNPYVSWVGESPALKDRVNDIFMNEFNLSWLKRSSSNYAGAEKKGVHCILKSNRNIVDVEVALSPESDGETDDEDQTPEGRRVADRIDFAAIRRRKGDQPSIVFFEAKRFDNSELKTSKGEPRVFAQIGKYEEFIRVNGVILKASYGSVCKDLVRLTLPNRYDPVVKDIADNPEQLAVDPYVRLVVFGFDEDQRVGKVWNKHKQKLEGLFGNRLLLKGNPSEFTFGISN